MTSERAFAGEIEGADTIRHLELVPDEGFAKDFKSLLDYVQDAAEQMGRCDEVLAAEQGARKYAEKYWPNGQVLSITLPEGSRAYDHNGHELEDYPDAFRTDFFAGHEMGKARFLDLRTSRFVVIPDIRDSDFLEIESNGHPGCE